MRFRGAPYRFGSLASLLIASSFGARFHAVPATVVPMLASVVVAALVGCDSMEPERLPPAVAMIPFQSDPFAERGIRPDPNAPDDLGSESGAILVEWAPLDPVQIARFEVGGYRIFRSDGVDDSGRPLSFSPIVDVPITVGGSDTTYSDTSAQQNIRYYYYVRSYSRADADNLGEASDTVSFTLTERPMPRSPIGPTPLSEGESLAFRFSPSTAAGRVAISIDEVHPDDDRTVIREVWRDVGRADFNDPHIVHDGDGLIPGRRYRWNVRKIFSEGQPLGNTSQWVTFSIQ